MHETGGEGTIKNNKSLVEEDWENGKNLKVLMVGELLLMKEDVEESYRGDLSRSTLGRILLTSWEYQKLGRRR